MNIIKLCEQKIIENYKLKKEYKYQLKSIKQDYKQSIYALSLDILSAERRVLKFTAPLKSSGELCDVIDVVKTYKSLEDMYDSYQKVFVCREYGYMFRNPWYWKLVGEENSSKIETIVNKAKELLEQSYYEYDHLKEKQEE